VNSSKALFTYNTSSAINEIIKTTDLIIYPNPSNDIIYLKGNEKLQKYERIDILDISGVILKSKQFSNSIDISDLPKGNYLLRFIYTESNYTLKFIKN